MSEVKSAIHFFAIGTVMAHNKNSSPVIYVNPTEHLQGQHGAVTKESLVTTFDGMDPFGKPYSGKIKTTTFQTATWYNQSHGQFVPPCVRLGERVLLWREGESTKLFWTSMQMDMGKRRTDRMTMGVVNVNRDKPGTVEIGLDQLYHLTWDTIAQTIELTTSKNNGERWIHRAKFTESTINLEDDVNNSVFLDSENTLVRLTNEDESRFELNKKDINHFCHGDYTMDVEGSWKSTVGKDRTQIVKGKQLTTIGGTDTLIVDGVIDYTSKSEMNMKASAYNMTTGKATFSGQVICASLSIGGGGAKSAADSCVVKGGLNADSMTVDQITVGAGGITSTGNITAPNLKYT